MKTIIQRWLGLPTQTSSNLGSINPSHLPLHEIQAGVQVELVSAVNGRILRVAKYTPNPHGPDWTHTLYVVPDDQTLPDAIATCLVLGGLNN